MRVARIPHLQLSCIAKFKHATPMEPQHYAVEQQYSLKLQVKISAYRKQSNSNHAMAPESKALVIRRSIADSEAIMKMPGLPYQS